MFLEYDCDLDVLYVKLCDGVCAESKQVEMGVVLDYDRNRCLIGIEIENASETLDPTALRVQGLDVAGASPRRK